MNNIALIGASGFIGTRFIDIAHEHYTLLNLDKDINPKYPKLTKKGDILDRNFLDNNLLNQDTVILLAAEHHDNVNPVSLYYDVNVQGTKNVLDAMDRNGVKNIIFTSSVAVYGLDKVNPNEEDDINPFNHYGKSKWQAENILKEWYQKDPKNRSVTVIRPTVVFGEGNRGNVYNLLKQIVSGKFLRIGSCNNKKSMAYVGNIAAFIQWGIEHKKPGYDVYNYADKPDFTMNELLKAVSRSLNIKISSFKVPYFLGLLGGYGFDLLARIMGKKLPISSVRVKKFCATTQFDAAKASQMFKAPYTLEDGLRRTLEAEFK